MMCDLMFINMYFLNANKYLTILENKKQSKTLTSQPLQIIFDLSQGSSLNVSSNK